MNDTSAVCPFCHNTGFANDRFCVCPVGLTWRASPRVIIGNETLVFPPGTTMEEARSVVADGVALAVAVKRGLEDHVS